MQTPLRERQAAGAVLVSGVIANGARVYWLATVVRPLDGQWFISCSGANVLSSIHPFRGCFIRHRAGSASIFDPDPIKRLRRGH